MIMKNNKPDLLVIIIGFAIFLLVIGYLSLYLLGISYQNTINTTPEAKITILPPEYIPTIDTLFLVILPTSTPQPNQGSEGEFPLDSYVQITGTGGNGLRLREKPGTEAQVKFIAAESEVFKVIGGPVQDGNYTWWQLTAPYDNLRQGWAAGDFLSTIKQ
jgi:hypothetical protein